MRDYIDRQAAIDELTEPDYENGEAYLQYEEDIKTIKNLPSAWLKPKTGKWLYKIGAGWGETWICSECGEKTTSTATGKPRYKWCPMCGTRMEGEQE